MLLPKHRWQLFLPTQLALKLQKSLLQNQLLSLKLQQK